MAQSKEMKTWVTVLDDDGKPRYRIKSDYLREVYFLYEVNGDKEIKTKHKSKNPIELYDYCIM